MLPRIDRIVNSTRQGRGMDLPEKRGSTKKAGVLTIKEEARDDHDIRADEEYIWEVQKLPKDS
jgi:hypothetical protein